MKYIWKFSTYGCVVPLIEATTLTEAIRLAESTIDLKLGINFENCIFSVERLGMLPQEFNKIGQTENQTKP
jgi:hypothetical protein